MICKPYHKHLFVFGYAEMHRLLKVNEASGIIKILELLSSFLRVSAHLRYLLFGELFKVALLKVALVESVEDKRVVDVGCNGASVSAADNEVGVACKKLVYCGYTHLGCHYSVAE